MKQISSSDALEFANKFINYTDKHVFLTGKAGTGKTTFVDQLRKNTIKQAIVVAPTGVAALNAGGVTIHSQFGLSLGGFIPNNDIFVQNYSNIQLTNKHDFLYSLNNRINSAKKDVLREIELLIIDEVSMLRADVLDAINWTLCYVRGNNRPFGGVQLLLVGDLYQLQPVVKDHEWHILSKYYETIFFFSAHVLKNNPPVYIELRDVFRQTDRQFIEILNRLRENKLTYLDVQLLNKKVNASFDHSAYITLTSHNQTAFHINQKAFERLPGEIYTYHATISGQFPQYLYPLDIELNLKIGAKVMLKRNSLRNNKESYYNGTLAVVVELTKHAITVEVVDTKEKIHVRQETWEHIEYTPDPKTNRIKKETVGTFVHFPLVLAWAITIHKSQGLSFDKACLDIASVFAPGQAYVALSRLRSLDGLILKSPIDMHGIDPDQLMVKYEQKAQIESELEKNNIPSLSKIAVLHYISDTYDWKDVIDVLEKHEHDHAHRYFTDANESTWIYRSIIQTKELYQETQKLLDIIETALFHTDYQPQRFIEAVKTFIQHSLPTLEDSYFNVVVHSILVDRIDKKKWLSDLDSVKRQLFNRLSRLRKTPSIVESVLRQKLLYNADQHYTTMGEYEKKIEEKATKYIEENPSVKIKDKATKTTFKTNTSDKNNKHTSEVAVRGGEQKTTLKQLQIISQDGQVKTLQLSTNNNEQQHTVEITWRCIEEGWTPEQIAQERQIGIQIVYGHLMHLITNGKIHISQLINVETLQKLDAISKRRPNISIMALKISIDEDIPIELLRCYQVHRKSVGHSIT